MGRNHIIVLELDGATWDVADPLIEAGKLPNLARVKQQGAWGVLRSLEPMISPALWTTIYTGKTAEEHGIASFGDNTNSLRCRRLWDILNEAGYSIGLMGSLATWPPRPVRQGFIIPDYIMALDSQTYPPHLEYVQQVVLDARLQRTRVCRSIGPAWRLLQTGVHPLHVIQSGILLMLSRTGASRLDLMWRQILALEGIKSDVFLHLYHQYHPRFATYHYHATDTTGHFYWRYYQPDRFTPPPAEQDVSRYSQVIPRTYVQADRLLGRLLRQRDPLTTLVIISDHGQEAYPPTASQSFLNLAVLTEFLGIAPQVTPVRIANGHYLHFQSPDPIQRVERILTGARFKSNGQPVFYQITTDGRCLSFKLVPEIFSETPDDEILFPGQGQLPTRALRMQTGPPITSGHSLNGLVALYGPLVRPGTVLDDASILDVMPTILAMFDLPVARDMKGRVWWEALQLDRTQAKRPINSYEKETEGPEPAQPALKPEDRERLLDRLRDLGYI